MNCKRLARRLAAAMAVVFSAACLGLDQGTGNGNATAIDSVTFRAVDVGGLHTCGIVEGDLGYCWGNNSVGQLGTGDVLNHSVPRKVAQGDLVLRHVSAGGLVSCAVTDDQVAYCWGSNQFGQVGNGEVGTPPAISPEKVLGDHQFTTVSAGAVHVCGLVDDGEVWCWGLAGPGLLGNGISGDNTWSGVPDSAHTDQRFRVISAGSNHTCGLTPSGEAYCWGENTRGQLGNGTTENAEVPVQVVGGILFHEIDTGADHTCALDLEGNAYCWGSNFSGQLGAAAVVSSDTPVMVTGGLSFEIISAGTSYTCAVDNGSIAYCWGINDDGRLGDGTLISRNEPTMVAGNLDFETISAGEGGSNTATCGFTLDSLVYCWGDGLEGQLGTGSTGSSTSPVPVVGQR
jgi:alpha-tubulin suppressor-like RCC1 family protein